MEKWSLVKVNEIYVYTSKSNQNLLVSHFTRWRIMWQVYHIFVWIMVPFFSFQDMSPHIIHVTQDVGWQFCNQDWCIQITIFKGLLRYCTMCWPYRSVEVALAVHGDVQPCLGALDGHYPEPHRNQVELHCKKKKNRERMSGVRAIILPLKRSQCFLDA